MSELGTVPLVVFEKNLTLFSNKCRLQAQSKNSLTKAKTSCSDVFQEFKETMSNLRQQFQSFEDEVRNNISVRIDVFVKLRICYLDIISSYRQSIVTEFFFACKSRIGKALVLHVSLHVLFNVHPIRSPL